MMQRRSILQALATIPACSLPNTHAQEKYPSQAITIVVPYAPGGNVDAMARLVSVQMGKTLGQAVVIENRPGAAGVIGTDFVNRSKPNGYTLVCTANGSFIVAPRMVPKRPFQTTDFAAVGSIGSTPMVLEGNPKGRFKTLSELIGFAKAHPEEVTLGHPGNGTTNHIAILRLQEVTGARFGIVAYKGSAPALNDLLGGQIDGLVDQLPSSLPHIKAHKLIPYALTSKEGSSDLPGVKPLADSGYPNFEVTTVTGLLAPAKTPSAIMEALNKALGSALADSDVQRRLRTLGTNPMPGSAKQFADFLLTEDQSAESMFRQGLLRPE
ncbi:MAG: tripartite tricarboxylate transporter substrate binding protein [Comamonas sp.]|jgi:tripartite-type tricarboxylate transporter receptor subunit TctC|uniref:Bug family tripartite tricarboxylate transporter substrate binding protein n=1 Tax=Comamonas sp. TaxID=34028 RepID=UPI002826408E|nr:tripartite tricarboxylate transporter substrate binding protein [Comamonas sp.]MDR0215601.1 tripartite tricarboxylate transporter substrate binding protein [Comamonas sp.]